MFAWYQAQRIYSIAHKYLQTKTIQFKTDTSILPFPIELYVIKTNIK